MTLPYGHQRITAYSNDSYKTILIFFKLPGTLFILYWLHHQRLNHSTINNFKDGETMYKKILVAMILIIAFASIALVAGQAKVSTADSKEQTITKAERASFEGTLVCLGCSLKKG